MSAEHVEITVAGRLPAATVLRLRARGVRSSHRRTLLHGTVRDPAALLALLEQAHALGLDLVSVRRSDASAGGLAVGLVVGGGVGDVLLSMLDDLHDRGRLPCTTLAVRPRDVDAVLRALDERGATVLSTSAPLPPVAGDAAPAGRDESDVTVDPSGRHGARAHRARDEEGDVSDVGDVDAVEDTTEELGPIDYLVVEFPQNKLDGTAFPLLVDLVDRGIIRVLDLVFVEKDADGEVHAIELHEAASGEVDLSFFEGVSSGLLGDDDIAEAAKALENGSAAGILVFENRWAGPFAAALRRGGGQLVASGRIPVQAILAALDDLDAA